MNRLRIAVLAVWLTGAASIAAPPLTLDPEVVAAEAARREVIAKLSRSTVAIFESTGTNGGSGVIISDDGLVVTNFHVTAPCGPQMLVGTSDGRLHQAVLLGLDPTGDIGLIQLQGEGPYPAAAIGDSDLVRVGDEAIVAGNPFLLAEDFTPTITVGVISGVHRYQFPSGTLLEYADCLQTDAAINPGNSGGPLFDGAGRLIGINGRGSFEKRGRVNVGVGYAVSINQVMRFVSHLRTGRLVDHASLGATIVTRRGPQAIVRAIETTSDAYRRGLRPGDEIVAIDGRDTPTANALLNAIGVLPAGWRTLVEYRRDGRLDRRTVRLGPLHSPGEIEEAIQGETPDESPDAADSAKTPELPADIYEAKPGYANYAATRRETRRLLDRCRADSGVPLRESVRYVNNDGDAVTLEVTADGAAWLSESGEFRCDATRDLAAQATPPEAPALLGGLWVWSRLVAGEEGLLDDAEALGRLPWRAGETAHDVLVATHRGLRVEVYLDAESGRPLGFEASRDAAEEAVRVEFTDAPTGFGALPSELRITAGDRPIADLQAAVSGPSPQKPLSDKPSSDKPSSEERQ
ncbi:Periplasmic serine endoprotease DegP precursor [Botrimarina colliarenosi]|uniref:Periplasmic serine endoprotease DegP n=1 Tax=Botrimarina colliarenosi TaxID=2528001 RepID=A0A5C6A817_9BACT|nr:trypsin-like peptidase domain-containing protein [Botrimarina colliarenosi]TWT96094.1 Periplasmic serine endoprotease DegP precursor [Botrimarina colliarenosi]